MAGVVHVQWYATLFRGDAMTDDIGRVAALSLRYGATQYQVHRSRDDMYRITQMTWFESKADWYRYWEGPDMVAFRRRNSGRFQVPITYTWFDEIASGAMGPEVPLIDTPQPEPEPSPSTVA